MRANSQQRNGKPEEKRKNSREEIESRTKEKSHLVSALSRPSGPQLTVRAHGGRSGPWGTFPSSLSFFDIINCE